MESGKTLSPEVYARAKSQANYCKVFSNATRVLIIWALRDQELCVSAIAGCIASSMQNTSQHLRLMEAKGVLVSRRAGSMVYYRVCPQFLREGCLLNISTLFDPIVSGEQTNNPM